MTRQVRVTAERQEEPNLGLLALALIEIARELEVTDPARRQEPEDDHA